MEWCLSDLIWTGSLNDDYAIGYYTADQLPFYGKAAILNKAVAFYEAYLLLGVTVFRYTNAFRPAVNLGGGVRLFQNKYLSYRLEVSDNIVIKEKPEQVMQVNLMIALNFGS